MCYYSHVFFNEKGEVESRKLLETHLNEVYSLSKRILPKTFLDNLKVRGYTEDDILKLIKIISFCHDFGKFNVKFQEFITLNPYKKTLFKERRLKEHSLLSSVFGFFVAEKLFIEEKYTFLKSLIFYLIKMHHANLEDFGDEIHIISDMNLLNKQLELIGRESYKFYSEQFKITNIETDFKEFIRNIPNNDNFLTSNFCDIEEDLITQNGDFSIYFMINTFFSILHDADVHSASNIDYSYKKMNRFDIITEHIKKIQDERAINKERSEIFWKLNRKCQKINLDKRLYQITSPTGSGKTFASLNFALQLKKRLKERGNYKIIYSIPFTSIIDQTFETITNLFEDNNLPADTILLKHHYLTDLSKEKYADDSESSIPPELNRVILESWDSDLIITTFVQFFESLITNNKEMIKKTHNLYNTIIIIDECQNIPVQYWGLFQDFLNSFCIFFDSYIIFLTATQPLIFDKENKNAPIELLDNYTEYFSNKNRTEIIPTLEEKELGNFYNIIKKIILEKDYSSVLVVLNTIKDSQYIFRRINEDTSFYNYKKVYLSASLLPKTKMENIDLIKKLNRTNKDQSLKKRYIVVSTQVIEAGVDIDTEIIFRDFAPLENIIQTAGRCNREGERKTEQVYLFNIHKDEKQRALTIYDSYLLNVTKKLLNNNRSILESNYLCLFEEYVKEKSVSSNMSLNLRGSLQKLRYYNNDNRNEPISSFKLIIRDDNKVSCFININDESDALLHKYNEIKKIIDYRVKTKEWLPYKNRFQTYIVNIPEEIIQTKVNEFLNKVKKKPDLLILDKGEWENYYDITVGFTDSGGIWV